MHGWLAARAAQGRWRDHEAGYETYEQSVEWTPWHPPAWLPLDNIRKPKEYWEIIAYTKIPIVFLMIFN